MAGGLGATLDPPPPGIVPHGWWFGEDQARFIVETGMMLSVQLAALDAGVPIRRIGVVDGGVVDGGVVGGAALTLSGRGAISVAQLKAAHEAWLPGYMHQG
jgi:phosphoribosylformylglycinamidine synthase